MRMAIEFLAQRFNLSAEGRPEKAVVTLNAGIPEPAGLEKLKKNSYLVRLGRDTCQVHLVRAGEDVFIQTDEEDFHLRIIDPFEQAAQEVVAKRDAVKAPMPGVVVEILVKEGDFVQRGTPLMTIESMKIITVIRAPADGEVAEVRFPQGAAFEKGVTLVSLKDSTGGAR